MFADKPSTGGGASLNPASRERLLAAVGQLNGRRSVDELIIVFRGCARALADADGITLVRREGDEVHYVAEDAIEPLWAGQRFPVDACISGLAMIENRPILIPDVYADDRVPIAAYEPTFVRSMAMFPIGTDRPVWAMGAYWARTGPIDRDAATLLASLARAAAPPFERAMHAAPAAVAQRGTSALA